MNKKYVLILLLLVVQTARPQTWYVSGKGNDAADGKTVKTAFRTLQKAANLVQSGDVIWIGSGVYTNSDTGNGSAVLNITRSGRPNAWITWKAAPGQTPEVRPSGWNGIHISASYNVIDGLAVIGTNDSLVLIEALADAKNTRPNPAFNTNGIFVNGRTRGPSEKPHHTVIRNCTVSKCPGGGIVGIETDYLTIEDNLVFDNCWFMRYGGSGITTLNNWAYDDAPGYHIVIQRNKVWNNKTLVPWEKIGKLSDGNGILLDVTDQKRDGATNPNADAVVTAKDSAAPKALRPEWKGRALIAYNLSAYNGGSGIHTFRTRHVDIVHNTTYHNGGIVGYQELFPNNSEDVVILNNIIVPRPGGKVTSNNKNKNIRWDYNLYPRPQDVFVGAHDVVAMPVFRNIQADLRNADFRLAKGSPGLSAGSIEPGLPTAAAGKTDRPNRGAF